MAYGTVKVDNVTFTYNSGDTSTTFSGLHASTTNNLTLSGTASAATFTGTTANFTNVNAQNISVTTALSGLSITGGTAGFTTVTGTTVTGTTANFASGVFTTQISGVTVIATTGTFTSLTGTTTNGTTASFTTGDFTSLTGTTTTGTTANFASGVFTTQISGVTVIATTGTFTSLTGTTTTMTSGVFASGTEPLPSISFVSDPNTGIYSPGADQLAVATNGTGKLFIDSIGNIGVGAASPSAWSYAGNITIPGAGRYIASTTDDIRFASNVYSSDVDRYVANGFATRYRMSDGTHQWATAVTGTAGNTITYNESMRITAGGLVGIGTSAPSNLLTLNAPNANALTLFVGPNTDEYSSIRGKYGAGNDYAQSEIRFINADNPNGRGALAFAVGTNSTTEHMRITYDGKVGIGTSPSTLLHLSGSASFLTLNATTANSNNIIFQVSSATKAYIGLAGNLGGSDNDLGFRAESGNNQVFYIGSSEKARIDSSGRLLVGTSSSASAGNSQYSLLQVKGGSGLTSAVLSLTRAQAAASISSNSAIGSIAFGDEVGNPYAYITCESDAASGSGDYPGRLVFSTNPGSPATSPTERMRITNSGFAKFTNSGSYHHAVTTSRYEFRSNQNDVTFNIVNANASPTAAALGCNIFYTAASPNNTGCEFLYCEDSTTLRASIRSNGGLANYSANNANLSDRNVKKDIALAAGTWDCIKEWEIVNYRYKDQSDDADLNLGVIAQQVAENCPEVITIFQEAKDATEDKPAQEERLGIKEQQMYWMAIKALQEAMGRIETLEQRLIAAGID